MSYKFTDLPYLSARDPEELKQVIFRLLREFRGNATHTAEALGITKKQFYLYIHKLDILPEVQGIRDEFRRRGTTKRAPAGRAAEFVRRSEESPSVAAQMILWAYKDAKADVPKTCRELGLPRALLFKLAEQLGILPEMKTYAAGLRLERLETSRRDLGRVRGL